MKSNYTQAAKERCLDLIDGDIDSMWADISCMPEDSDADKWKKKLQKIAAEYTISSRFALMRLLQARVAQQSGSEEDGFFVEFDDGTVGHFGTVTLERAQDLPLEELELYEKWMLDAAARGEYGACGALPLIHKALQMYQKGTTLLTREEAMHLGHMLNWRLQEMEWFLLRVFPVSGGFRFNASGDLIDAYVFLRAENGRAGKRAEKLKQEYVALYGEKTADRMLHEESRGDWTMDNSSSLPEQVRSWSADNSDEQFMAWIGTRAEHLDFPSATALRIYRNLAVFAYNIANQIEDAPGVDVLRRSGGVQETDFTRCIREIVRAGEYADQTVEALFDGKDISGQKCRQVASSLLLENMNLSLTDQTDKTKAWHVIDMLTNGRMTVSGGINASRTRVQNLLYGQDIQIEKSDILYLLWFTANLCWIQAGRTPGPEELTTRLFDFIDAADNCLDAAGLPAFYPPHLVEQSMMLSIVYAYSGEEEYDPAEVYEQICASVIERRARRK